MSNLTTYHLYHHQPDPLLLDAVADRAWLINNAVTYSLVAVIDAPGIEAALQAAQCQAQYQRLPRSTVVHAGHLFRETFPGDVLVAANDAWMVNEAFQMRQISYRKSRSQRSFAHRSAIDDLAWSPDGAVLVIAENDRRVVFRPLASTREYDYAAYERGEYAAERLAWSPDGTRLATAGWRGEVHLFRPAPWHTTGYSSGAIGSILICVPEDDVSFAQREITALTWTPDGARIVAGRADGGLLSWNASTGQEYRLKPRHTQAIRAIDFSPSENHLLTGSLDATVQIWDEGAGQERVRYTHTRGVMSAVWSPDGEMVASCEQEDPAVHLWSAQTGQLLARLPLSLSTSQDPTIQVLAWSPDGSLLAAGCDDGTIQLLDLALQQHIQTYRTHSTYQRTVSALAWSPNGTLLASGGLSGMVDVWQIHAADTAQNEESAVPTHRREVDE